MSLLEKLKRASSEEDVKAAYISALGLKNVQRNLIDIQTKEIWFEAKDAPTSPYAMFAQLLHYVHFAQKKGEHIPPFLAVIDNEKAALLPTKNVMSLFGDRSIEWGKAASKVSREAIEKISTHIGTHFVAFKIETHEKEFIAATKAAIKTGEFVRIQITPDNLRQVFDKWVELIGRELPDVEETDYALLFYADVMHDGKHATHENLPARLLHDGEKPVFVLHSKNYELASLSGYRQFWSIYHKPPKREHRNHLLERRDTLLPLDVRAFKGAFYTPLHVVDKAYELLAATLGENWQEKYLVWDMCCGVGNLEVKHNNHRNVFMSTLDQADIDVMRASKTCVAATKFQYDYLNDDIDDFGRIDYSLTDKMPQSLRDAIAAARAKKSRKKILVLINPPYAEASNSDSTALGDEAEDKTGVARTNFAAAAMDGYGQATNELFMQFVARVRLEIPGATLAMFSKMKYVNAPTLETFRGVWKATYLGGFVVHSKAFDGLRGDFPIGFLIWDTYKHQAISSIDAEVLDKTAKPVGFKRFHAAPSRELLSNWVERPATNRIPVIPLKNAVTPATATKDTRGTMWSDGAIAYLNCAGNEPLNAGQKTMLFSSGYGSARGFFVTKKNLLRAAIVFSVRRLVKGTWLNDRDQFMQPYAKPKSEFEFDCLLYMLFNGSNLTAGADGLVWERKQWSLVNHCIPFSEAEVGASGRFESSFMADFLKGKKLSPDAMAVLAAGKQAWCAFFSRADDRATRELLKLNRQDSGWYQVRMALEARTKSASSVPFDFSTFETAYKKLELKLLPQIFDLGFLRE